MRDWCPAFVEIHEYDFVDRQNALTGDHVADLRTHSEGRHTEIGGEETHVDQVALARRTHKVGLGHKLRHDVPVAALEVQTLSGPPLLPTVCAHPWANESISFNHVDPKTVDFLGIFGEVRGDQRPFLESSPSRALHKRADHQ
jgi:hypothetical protein